jgi:nucleoside-diphosphate-sugar epimerase
VLPADGPWVQHPAAQCRWAALNDQAALTQVLQGCDVVIHAAAALEGDQATQHAVTVDGTRQLLAAMQRAGVARLVGISSLSVYDYLALADGATLDEHSALEAAPWQRDVYAR